MPLSWHRKFWSLVDPVNVREVRVTGGEPFEEPRIGEIVQSISSALGAQVDILLYTSGRPFVSMEPGQRGIDETVAAIERLGIVLPRVHIHMSADEYHAGTLYRKVKQIKGLPRSEEESQIHNKGGTPILVAMVKNLLAACDKISLKGGPFFGGARLKVHVGNGRGNYHRHTIFSFLSDVEWSRYVSFSEGLINAGRASFLSETIKVEPRHEHSIFIIPGAEFRPASNQSRAGQLYTADSVGTVRLQPSEPDGDGAMILGFWNLVEKRFVGGSALDALKIIGKPDAERLWRV